MNINNRSILLSFEHTPGYVYTIEAKAAGVYLSSDFKVLRLADLPEKLYVFGDLCELTDNKKRILYFTGIVKGTDNEGDEFWFSHGKLLKF